MKKINQYLTVKEVSKYLGIPRRTVYHLVKTGKIKSIRFGEKIRCLQDEIEQYSLYGTDLPQGLESVRKAAPYSEKRAYPRINSNLTCQYSISLHPFKDIENNEGIIKNISTGGVFLFNQSKEIKKIDVDDPIYLQFALTQDAGEKIYIKTKGKILRKTQNGVGIKFKDIREKLKNTIMEYAG